MQVVSRIILLSALAAGCAHAQPPAPDSHTPTPATANPTPLRAPPIPPELAPVSQDFQAAMANSQLATYRYTQLTEQAQALKKLCDTGFGPSDICPKGGIAVREGAPAQASSELPTAIEITGGRSGLSATLALADGRHVAVHPGTRLPDGSLVAGISGDDVRIVRAGGDEITLSFASAEPK